MAANREQEPPERITTHPLLEVAIRIAQQGDKKEARQLLRSYLEDHAQDERAWAWYVDTFSDDQKRLRILTAYLKYHPESRFARQAISSINRRLRRGESANKTAEIAVPFKDTSTGWPPTLDPESLQAKTQEPPITSQSQLSEGQPPASRKAEETRLLILAVAIILITIILAVAWTLLH
jgi:hypothetical protein